MAEVLRIGSPPITVVLRRSTQARQLTLRVPSIGGDPILTAPRRVARHAIDGFLVEREDWLRAALGRTPQPVDIVEGARIPVEGQLHTVQLTGRRGIRAEPGLLEVPRAGAGSALSGWLRGLARDRLATATTRYAAQLGEVPGKLTLRDTRSRWGSCTSDGNLMFSWRLIMAPVEVLDYVAAHEVAHLVEMNHSADFWAIVDRLKPGWQVHRDWLRSEGADLHRYRFDP